MLKFWSGNKIVHDNRILILGESHYDGDERILEQVEDNYTFGVMERYYQGTNYRFFNNIATSFGNKDKNEALDFFDKVYFGNYIVHYAAKGNHAIAKKLIAEYQEQYNDRLFNFVNEQHIKTIFCFSKNVYYGLG